MESKGNDALLKTTRVTEWTLNQGGYICILFGGFILMGCITAYAIAVARGNVDPFLPLISDAAGSPPQNGIFGTLVCIGGMFGVLFMILRYMIVEDKNRGASCLVAMINRLSLFIGIVSMFGITLITGYPINFYRNKEVWLADVGLPHMIGGVMLFSLGLVYIGLQCILTLFLKSPNQSVLLTRVALCLICTASFVYHMITVPEHFKGYSQMYQTNDSFDDLNSTNLMMSSLTMGVNLKLPIDMSGSYISSAITEWLLVFFFCCFFFTFFHEAQQYSLLIVVETHTKYVEVPEDSAIKFPHSSNQVDSNTGPEVKKYLRRDSTCQTMTEPLEKTIIAKPPSSKVVANGDSAKSAKSQKVTTSTSVATDDLTNDEIDAKLKVLLAMVDDEPLPEGDQEQGIVNQALSIDDEELKTETEENQTETDNKDNVPEKSDEDQNQEAKIPKETSNSKKSAEE